MKDHVALIGRNSHQLLREDLLQDELATTVLMPNGVRLQSSHPRTPIIGGSYLLLFLLLHTLPSASS